MKPGRVYRMSWQTQSVPSSIGGADRVASQNVLVQIFDYGQMVSDDSPVSYIDLQAAADPLEISVIDNDETKFKSIRAKQARIRFYSATSEGIDFSLFSNAYDNQFYVSITTGGGGVVFLGYLVLPDNQMPFLPEPQVVELTASDHLGVLKDTALVDDDGENIQGKYRIADLIKLCLKQTGLSLPVNVINNLRIGTGSRSGSNVVFAASDSSITVDFYIGFFYVGQRLVVSDSASNNGTYTVNSIVSSTKITVAESLTNETATIYNVTFTDDSSDGHFHDKAYIDAKTFEESIGVSVNCYTAIERILKDDCTLFQHSGEWWIVRIDEYDDNGLYVAKFNADGEIIQEPTLTDFYVNIGFSNSVIFANANQLVRANRPHKYVRDDFNYINPIEIVCNVDFSRGIGSSADPTQENQSIDYQLECWDFLREGSIGTIDDIDQSPYGDSYGVLTKRYEFGYEKERYLRSDIELYRHYFKSQPLPVSSGDKVEVGVSFRFANNPSVTNWYPVHVMIVGDDGYYYIWDYDSETDLSSWHQLTGSDPWFSYNFRYLYTSVPANEWANISATSLECPADGQLYIRLVSEGLSGSGGLWFSNLNVNYIPKINGSFQRYSGHYNAVTRTDAGYLANRKEDVQIGDAPRPIIKGAIFFQNGDAYKIAPVFYPAAKYGITGQPSASQIKPYGWHQIQAVWNQYREAYTILSGDLWGLPASWPDLHNVFSLTDPSSLTGNRYFMLISFSQNWKTGIWSGTFVEVFNPDNPKVYNTPFEFKYISDGRN